MASTYLQRTPTTRTNNKKFTFSCWIKRSAIASAGYIAINYESSNDRGYVVLDGNDKFNVYDVAGGTVRLNILSNFVLRDTNAWYHIVYSVDSTAGSNRVKFYVNGVDRYSDFAVTTAMSQDSTVGFQQGTVSNSFKIGSQEAGSTTFDGLMSHVNFVDGVQLDASDFGETDSTTGEWKIKTNPSVTYGNNGFFILKDGNSVTDQSGNSNNFTVGGGTLTKTEDCPSNVFATLNPLVKKVSSMSYSNGNNTITTSGSQWEGSVTTLAPSSGKWYWEAKYNTGSGIKLDIARQTSDLLNMSTANNSYLAYHGDGYGYQLNNSGTDYYCSNNSCTTWNSSINGNSTKIYMIAVDLDNGKYWIGANGTWANSSGTANPATGDDPRHSFSAKLNGDPWLFSMSVEGGSGSHNANFGNGYFGTTAVSSAGTNASGIGIFEYDVPAGFTALCTKGLNE